MGIPFYIAIEPQDYDDYVKEVPKEQLLVLPFSNHGDGPGRARNWCWEHSISIGAKKHWVMDDNINDFYRLHNNKRYRVESGVLFKSCEDFINRYENVPVSGLNYMYLLAPDSKRPAYVKNTRIYSCLLIDNNCKFKWRGRYNEDTDLSLRVLKDGDCTIQFNHFLQGKSGTQKMKGGNTDEFYHQERTDNEAFKKTGYNPYGTYNKTKLLVDTHPDVTSLVWRYGRYHHQIDYGIYKKTKLRLKPEFRDIEDGINNYGLELVQFSKKGVPLRVLS